MTQPLPNSPILRCSALRKVFRMGESAVEVLKGVDLAVRAGEFVAIEGKSGSGKSTLLHILSGLDSADAGLVEVEGQDISELAALATKIADRGNSILRLPILGLSIKFIIDLIALSGLTPRGRADRKLASIRNREFGFVFQFYHLLPEFTVLENTMLSPMIEHSWLGYRGRRRDLRERAAEVLKQLGLSHRLKHRPNQLSGGERQRVAIARALMNQPRVLFADEPTGNLDADTGRQIMDVLEKLHQEKGQTILMVTHDRALAREADRVLLLRDGKLSAEK